MKIIKYLLIFFLVGLAIPKTSLAFDFREVFTSGDSIVVKIRERVEYFFANSLDKKVEVLEKQADRRLEAASNNVENGDDKKVPNLLQNYLQIKNIQNDLLENTDEEVLDKVQERTLGQQIVMEGIKGKIDVDGKQGVAQVQEQVVNQVAQRIVEVNGKEGQTEFFNKVEHVWAPGTGPGGPAPGVVYEGGARIIFAPGTSAGGESGVKYEGGAGQQFAPGTSSGGGGGNAGADIRSVEVVGN